MKIDKNTIDHLERWIEQADAIGGEIVDLRYCKRQTPEMHETIQSQALMLACDIVRVATGHQPVVACKDADSKCRRFSLTTPSGEINFTVSTAATRKDARKDTCVRVDMRAGSSALPFEMLHALGY